MYILLKVLTNSFHIYSQVQLAASRSTRVVFILHKLNLLNAYHIIHPVWDVYSTGLRSQFLLVGVANT